MAINVKNITEIRRLVLHGPAPDQGDLDDVVCSSVLFLEHLDEEKLEEIHEVMIEEGKEMIINK